MTKNDVKNDRKVRFQTSKYCYPCIFLYIVRYGKSGIKIQCVCISVSLGSFFTRKQNFGQSGHTGCVRDDDNSLGSIQRCKARAGSATRNVLERGQKMFPPNHRMLVTFCKALNNYWRCDKTSIKINSLFKYLGSFFPRGRNLAQSCHTASVRVSYDDRVNSYVEESANVSFHLKTVFQLIELWIIAASVKISSIIKLMYLCRYVPKTP
jgi:hypothetical protein